MCVCVCVQLCRCSFNNAHAHLLLLEIRNYLIWCGCFAETDEEMISCDREKQDLRLRCNLVFQKFFFLIWYVFAKGYWHKCRCLGSKRLKIRHYKWQNIREWQESKISVLTWRLFSPQFPGLHREAHAQRFLGSQCKPMSAAWVSGAHDSEQQELRDHEITGATGTTSSLGNSLSCDNIHE